MELEGLWFLWKLVLLGLVLTDGCRLICGWLEAGVLEVCCLLQKAEWFGLEGDGVTQFWLLLLCLPWNMVNGDAISRRMCIVVAHWWLCAVKCLACETEWKLELHKEGTGDFFCSGSDACCY